MDWSDEVRARLVREEERLRYKAANLQARGKTVMAAQELVVADDIRAALGEIERLSKKAELCVSCDKPGAILCRQCARAEFEQARIDRDEAIAEAVSIGRESKRLEAEVERLREALGRVLTEAGLQAHKHGCANKIARPAQWDARLPCAGCQAESALQGR